MDNQWRNPRSNAGNPLNYFRADLVKGIANTQSESNLGNPATHMLKHELGRPAHRARLWPQLQETSLTCGGRINVAKISKGLVAVQDGNGLCNCSILVAELNPQHFFETVAPGSGRKVA